MDVIQNCRPWFRKIKLSIIFEFEWRLQIHEGVDQMVAKKNGKCSNLFCILYFFDNSTVPDTKEVPGGGGAEVHLKSDLTNSMMHPGAERHLSKM